MSEITPHEGSDLWAVVWMACAVCFVLLPFNIVTLLMAVFCFFLAWTEFQ